MEHITVNIQSLIGNLVVVNADGKTTEEIKQAMLDAIRDVKVSCSGNQESHLDKPSPQPVEKNHPDSQE